MMHGDSTNPGLHLTRFGRLLRQETLIPRRHRARVLSVLRGTTDQRQQCDIQCVVDVLARTNFAQGLSIDVLQRLALHVNLEFFEQGSIIIGQDLGQARVVRTLGCGHGFGELALQMDGGKRAATIRATEATEAFVLNGSTYRKILGQVHCNHVNARVELLIRLPVFKGVSVSLLQDIASIMERRTYRLGDSIFKQGDLADAMYILANGTIRLRRLMAVPNSLAGNPVRTSTHDSRSMHGGRHWSPLIATRVPPPIAPIEKRNSVEGHLSSNRQTQIGNWMLHAMASGIPGLEMSGVTAEQLQEAGILYEDEHKYLSETSYFVDTEASADNEHPTSFVHQHFSSTPSKDTPATKASIGLQRKFVPPTLGAHKQAWVELSTLMAPEYFGETAMLGRGIRHATAIAESYVECLVLSKLDFDLKFDAQIRDRLNILVSQYPKDGELLMCAHGLQLVIVIPLAIHANQHHKPLKVTSTY